MTTPPQFVVREMFGSARSSRFGAAVTNAFWHTEEGNATAIALANYCRNPANNASYHDILRDGIVCNVVDDDYASWSVLNANPYSYNLCFAGSRASWTEAQWMARSDDIRIAVWLTLEVCRRKGTIATQILADGGGKYRRGSGIADHNYVTKILGIGNHTDLGVYFPWWFAKQVLAEYLAPAPVPAVVLNVINEEYKRLGGATSWLGERTALEERDCRTRDGKFAEFANGAIYWSHETGAKAISTHLLDAYAQYEWETGPLGYPIGDRTILTGPDGKPWGEVQGFEGGPLYRKYGQSGHRVHGLILATWRRADFENGELGWPTSDEITLANGDIVQHFEGGDVFYSATGTVALRPTDGPDQHFPISH